MPECNRCGSFVTPRFTRVFGNNEDTVYGCRDCLPVSALIAGGASRDGS